MRNRLSRSPRLWRRISWSRLGLMLAVVACLTAACEACPTCKEGINDGPNHMNMIRGYFWSIIFMMSMPFTIFGGLGIYFYGLTRKHRATQAAEPITRDSLRSIDR